MWFIWIIYFATLLIVLSIVAWVVNKIILIIQKDNEKYRKKENKRE